MYDYLTAFGVHHDVANISIAQSPESRVQVLHLPSILYLVMLFLHHFHIYSCRILLHGLLTHYYIILPLSGI